MSLPLGAGFFSGCRILGSGGEFFGGKCRARGWGRGVHLFRGEMTKKDETTFRRNGRKRSFHLFEQGGEKKDEIDKMLTYYA